MGADSGAKMRIAFNTGKSTGISFFNVIASHLETTCKAMALYPVGTRGMIVRHHSCLVVDDIDIGQWNKLQRFDL